MEIECLCDLLWISPRQCESRTLFFGKPLTNSDEKLKGTSFKYRKFYFKNLNFSSMNFKHLKYCMLAGISLDLNYGLKR
jgi:hypothetical protein